MSTQAFRAAVFGAIDTFMTTNYPNTVVMYENGPEVDEADAGELFVDVELRWYGASLTAVGPESPGRHTGAVSVHLYCKQATGTAAADVMLDQLIALLQRKNFAGGYTKMPQRTVPFPAKGWYKTGCITPFTLDVA